MITARNASRLMADYLKAEQIGVNRVSAKIIDFTDLARKEAVFVYLDGWPINPEAAAKAKTYARDNGFFLMFR